MERAETATRKTEAHSFTVAISFLGSAFCGICLSLAGPLLLNHNASAQDLDAHITTVVKIKLDRRVWLELHTAKRAQVNGRARQQAGAAGCTCVIHCDWLVAASCQACDELLRHHHRS